LDLDKEWFEGLLHKANEASEDPLETFLAFLEILAMELSGNSDGHPGCMTTACCYQDRLLNNDVKQVAAKILIQWRQTSLVLLRKVAAQHPPRIDVDLQDMADMLPALIDGSIIFSRIVADWSILPRQIRLYRALVESTFAANTVE